MSQISPNGPRKRYAPMVAFTLVAGALCLGFTGCGGGTTPGAKGVAESKLAPPGEFNKQNAEQYGAIVENEFRSPLVAPRSTFSADVNTASYSNVRRFITAGQAAAEGRGVPRRVRQLLPLRLRRSPRATTRSRSTSNWARARGSRSTSSCASGCRRGQIATDEMPPRNLVFLIDTSGSMARSNRLPLVQEVARPARRPAHREGPRQHRHLRRRRAG